MSENEKKSPSAPKNEKAEKAVKSKAESSKSGKSAKADKSDKSKKPTGFKLWLREMKSELKKVQWPSKKQTATHTTTVLCCVGLVGVFIWLFDFLATNVIDALISLV